MESAREDKEGFSEGEEKLSPGPVDRTKQDQEKEEETKKRQIEEIKAKENIFKGITDDISILSADLHSKMNSASAFVGKILLDSTDEESENDNKEPKETFINSALNTVGKVASNVQKEMEDVASSMSKDMDQVAKEITGVAKSVTKEMGNVSSSVSSSVALAMENVERVTVNMGKGVKDSLMEAVLLKNNKKEKIKGEVVWSDCDSKHQEQIKEKVLALSHQKTNLTEAPWIQLDPLKGGNFDFDYELFAPSALVMLKEDEKLTEMRYELVPKLVQEEQFWRNYFYRVQMIKQQFMESEDSMEETCQDEKKVEDTEELDGQKRKCPITVSH